MLEKFSAAPLLAVVGGGAVGLVCALAAVDDGWRVQVYDAGPQRRAAQVAGGMLGCLGEARPGEEPLLAASAASVAHWPALLRRLDDPEVSVADDTLLVAADVADRAYLDEAVAGARGVAGAAIEELSGTGLRGLEPGLTRPAVGGYRLVGEGAVDNRRLLRALRAALTSAGAELIDQHVTDPVALPADQILVASGLDSGAVLPGGLDGLRGEKGEILRLRRTTWSVAPPRQVVRARWRTRNVYLVPRADGVVVGATQYEALDVDDRSPQAGGVADLLADACEVFPGLRTYELTEAAAGIRPMSADGLPIVRRIDERLLVAAGHGRNGIALAPGTSRRVLELLGAGAHGERARARREERSAR
ncbi:FAD-dependent oxidoreductase [Gordonia alkaliphila]|uniref:Glycine oxidase ThiO n=1 Tax=Gordonia alkaliphila TaxID=1053547 RepID=A0ABP8ZGW4_9ACTN